MVKKLFFIAIFLTFLQTLAAFGTTINNEILISNVRPGGYAEYVLSIHDSEYINYYIVGEISNWIAINQTPEKLVLIIRPPEQAQSGSYHGFLTIERKPADMITTASVTAQTLPLIITLSNDIISHVIVKKLELIEGKNTTLYLTLENVGNINNTVNIFSKINELSNDIQKIASVALPPLSQRSYTYILPPCKNCTFEIFVYSREGLIRHDLIKPKSKEKINQRTQAETQLRINTSAIVFFILLGILIALKIYLKKRQKSAQIYPKTLNRRKTYSKQK